MPQGEDNRALVVDAEAATSGVIVTAVTEIGLPRLVGRRPAAGVDQHLAPVPAGGHAFATAGRRGRARGDAAPEARRLHDRPQGHDRAGHLIAGMFSVLDAIMGAPLGVLLEQLPPEPSIADALLMHVGEKGAALAALLAFERGHPAGAVGSLGPGTDPGELQRAYAAAVECAALTAPQMRGEGAAG